MDDKALIVVERIVPETIFNGDGMQPLLDEIKKKVTGHTFDPTTAKGRDEIVSLAYKVSRSKTLIESVGDTYILDVKSKVKKYNGIIKTAKMFLDDLRDTTRQPVTEWEAEEANRQAEADRIEREKIQRHVDALLEYGVVMPFIEVATMPYEEYCVKLSESKDAYEAEQDRKSQEEADRKAEEKRLADQKAEQDRIAKEQAEAQAKIDALIAKVARDRQALDDEKNRVIQVEIDRLAAENARLLKIETDRKIAEQTRIKEELLASAPPPDEPNQDILLILAYCANIGAVTIPEIDDFDMACALANCVADIDTALSRLKTEVEK